MAKNSKEPTLQEERFILKLLEGASQAEAYAYAYPKNRASSMQNVYDAASKVMKRPRVKKRYEELKKELQERELVKTGWTREQAIETLKFVITTNKKDMERIQDAAEEELLLLAQRAAQKPPAEAAKLLAAMIMQKKRARANRTNNDALIGAVSELNKMQGFNEQNINMNTNVMFAGEEELQD